MPATKEGGGGKRSGPLRRGGALGRPGAAPRLGGRSRSTARALGPGSARRPREGPDAAASGAAGVPRGRERKPRRLLRSSGRAGGEAVGDGRRSRDRDVGVPLHLHRPPGTRRHPPPAPAPYGRGTGRVSARDAAPPPRAERPPRSPRGCPGQGPHLLFGMENPRAWVPRTASLTGGLEGGGVLYHFKSLLSAFS